MSVLYPSSAKMMQSVKQPVEHKVDAQVDLKSKYKFTQMCIGQSFGIPFTDMSETVVRNTVSKVNARLKESGKKFKVIKWSEYGVYEIGRIA